MATSISRSGWVIGGVVILVLVAGSWLTMVRVAGAQQVSSLIGRDLSAATTAWGVPVCRASATRVTSRESAARRAEGRSNLVVPHAELVVIDPTPMHGRGSRISDRVLVFTDDPDVRRFIGRHTAGDLAATSGETRIAIDRSQAVRFVEIDTRDRILASGVISPVFLTVVRR